MARSLKCFISAAYDLDLTSLKAVLAENHVAVSDMFDLSIGDSIQDILKRKLREADFCIFVVSETSKNVLYEMGVAEGLGKQSLVIIDKKAHVPFYLDNKISLSVNLEDRHFLEIALLGFLDEIKDKIKPGKSRGTTSTTTTTMTTTADTLPRYSDSVLQALQDHLEHIIALRTGGNGRDIERLLADVFKSLHIKYADNSRMPDVGVDFAIWNDSLGRVIGNPIIVEVKTGHIDPHRFKQAQEQLAHYAVQSDAKAGLLLYLDSSDRRYDSKPTLNPLIITYDLEDFIREIQQNNFESVILRSRNKTAHGQ